MLIIILGLTSYALASAQTKLISHIDEIYQRFAPEIAHRVDCAQNKPNFLSDLDIFEVGPVRDLLSNTSPAQKLTAILG